MTLVSSESRQDQRREERGERALCVLTSSCRILSSSVVRLPRMKHTRTSISCVCVSVSVCWCVCDVLTGWEWWRVRELRKRGR